MDRLQVPVMCDSDELNWYIDIHTSPYAQRNTKKARNPTPKPSHVAKTTPKKKTPKIEFKMAGTAANAMANSRLRDPESQDQRWVLRYHRRRPWLLFISDCGNHAMDSER